MKPLLTVLLVSVAAIAGRTRLVDLLTKSTGTWVGSPAANTATTVTSAAPVTAGTTANAETDATS